MIRPLAIVFSLSLLGACAAYPKSEANQGGPQSGLYFVNAPANAVVSIDGGAGIDAAVFDGHRRILTVAPGPHRVTVSAGPRILYDKPVSIDAGVRLRIEVPE
jgi:hypothetical protein